ncbi:lactate utilization protein [Aliihoeflea aestuarii]|uniref:LutC/YkgG family protein n=1 Tax=Aliihoeflea aestuarii TaxID=453840 RepID=UPI00209267BC|nr:lactate utilization protein [Aliihoeflea aestuarii]MCO6389713.1 lactate utilization protein [Aliihoeflea aestuarii]
MSGREAILNKVRASLNAGAGDRKTAVDERLRSAPRGLIPARGQLADAERVALFEAQAAKVFSTTERLASHADLPAAVASYLRSKNLPASIRMGGDPRLRGSHWSSQPALEVRDGPSDGSDEAGLSHAFGAIAETGTLVLHSGPDNPTTVNFLPEHHLVVVDAKDVAGDLETVLANIRDRFGKGVMPRTLNMITGPSRSGDIEQKMLLGAHGPRALHVFIVEG